MNDVIFALEQSTNADPGANRLWILLAQAKMKVGDQVGALGEGENRTLERRRAHGCQALLQQRATRVRGRSQRGGHQVRHRQKEPEEAEGG